MKDKVLQGRYQIQRQLRKNAGRRALLAKDLVTEELVIIKLLIFGNDFKWQDLKLLTREAQILQELSHPAIPRYLDYFELDLPDLKGFALVQTHIPAKSLVEHLRAGRTFSEIELKQIAKSLLKVLIYLHERLPPVIHRDLKASNILLGDPPSYYLKHRTSSNSKSRKKFGSHSLTHRSWENVGQVYVVDFGSVKTAVAQQDGTMTVVGTYGYMPPEQFGGRAFPASDLYGLGATLIHLVTGKHPADLLQDDMTIKFEELVNLSPAFVDWLKWLTEPSLKLRMGSARKALEALDMLSHRHFPLVVFQPQDSKIKYVNRNDLLEVIIPPPGFSLRVGFLCFFDLIWLSLLINWSISVWGKPLLVLFPLFHWVFAIWILLAILFTLFGKIRFSLTPKKISLTYELFGLKYPSPFSAHSDDIWKIELLDRHIVKPQGARVEPIRVSVPNKLIIWARKRKYVLGQNTLTQWLRISQRKVLHASELDWLAQEIGDWLELPISRE